MFRRWPAVSIALALSACATQQAASGPMPICLAEVASAQSQESQSQQLPPDVWFSIMLKNFDRPSMMVRSPAQNCQGQTIPDSSANSLGTCPPNTEALSPLPDRALTPDDLITSSTTIGDLVWVSVVHFANGEALGPLARVEWTPQGVAVRTLGTLQAQKNQIRFRVESAGARQLLVIESEACENEGGSGCDQLVQLMEISGDKFISPSLVDENGQCLGRPVFVRAQSQEIELENAWIRKFEINRTLKISDGTAEISEQLKVADTDPEQPDNPPQLFRQASSSRKIQFTEAGIVTSESLWDKMIREHGSVRPDAE